MDFHKLKFKTRWFPALMNLIGLGIAFSIFLILLSQVWWDYRYDRFKGSEQVYVVEVPGFREGLYSTSIVRPMVQMIADCSPDISVACNYEATRNDRTGIIQIKDAGGDYKEVMGINLAVTETAALDVFQVELVEGRRDDFTKKGDAIISESAAALYFPGRDPIGETLIYSWKDEYRITGIYKDRKENESMVNGFLLHQGEEQMAFAYCFVKLAPNADSPAVEEAVGKVELGMWKDLRIVPIHKVWFQKDLDRWGTKTGGNRLLCFILTAIAVLFLCIAGFNYVNFAMASMPFHIKDINTRKVFGAGRTSLVLWQLGRAFLLVGCAFLLGILAMRTISGTSLSAFLSWNMEPAKNWAVISIGVAAAVLLALVSGLVPALYSTSFPPALVLKGTFATSLKGGGWRTATIALQFVLSFVFIICGMMLHRQTSYMVNNRELGFDFDRVLKVESTLYSPLEEVIAEVREIPGVVEVARGGSPMFGSLGSMSEIKEADEIVQYGFRFISPEYAGFFHFRLKDGRLPLTGESAVALVNESFAEAVPSCGIGKTLKSVSGDCTVIGVLEYFHARSLENGFTPLVMIVGGFRAQNFNSFIIRVEPNADVSEILARARKIYSEMKDIQEEEIEAGFLHQDIEKLYEQEIRQTRLIRFSSILSLIITLVGILGVVWLDTRFMRKEIAIRKVNGAMRREILLQISRKYLLIATVSFVIAVPIAIAICQRWLQHFAFRTNMPAWLFALAFVIVIGITLVTVVLQAWMAASANPIESIKNE